MDCSVQMFHHHNQWKRSTQSQSISLANMFYSFSLACMCVALMVYSKLTMIHNSSWMLAPTMFYILLVIYITYMYVHVHVRCVVHTVIITHVHVLLYCRFYSWKFLLWKRIQDTRHWKRLAVPVGGRLIGDRLIGYRLIGYRLIGDRLIGYRLIGGWLFWLNTYMRNLTVSCTVHICCHMFISHDVHVFDIYRIQLKHTCPFINRHLTDST